MAVEKLDGARSLANDLRGHPPTAAAAETAATAAAAESTAAAAAESVTTATESIAATEAVAATEPAILEPAAEIVATKTVALVPAAPAAIAAASFVETHALLVFPTSPKFTIKNHSVGRQTQVFGRYRLAPHSPAYPKRRTTANKFV
ncbi:hypothetical protein NFE57_08695 [Hephaestia sp. MAHUQ-44]|nr:hypothetical protein [Hephaestia sp. MAHUQ-44]